MHAMQLAGQQGAVCSEESQLEPKAHLRLCLQPGRQVACHWYVCGVEADVEARVQEHALASGQVLHQEAEKTTT